MPFTCFGVIIMKIYLDDVRMPYDNTWTLARNHFDFLKLIKNRTEPLEAISFDHDLGIDSDGHELKNGMEIAKLFLDLVQFQDNFLARELKVIIVHSSNPPGADNIRGIFKSAVKVGILSSDLVIR